MDKNGVMIGVRAYKDNSRGKNGVKLELIYETGKVAHFVPNPISFYLKKEIEECLKP